MEPWHVDGNRVDDEVASCVAGVIKDIEFPSSGGGIQATYPFHFVDTPCQLASGILELRCG